MHLLHLGRMGAIGCLRPYTFCTPLYTCELRRQAALHLLHAGHLPPPKATVGLPPSPRISRDCTPQPRHHKASSPPRRRMRSFYTAVTTSGCRWNRSASLAAPFGHPKARAVAISLAPSTPWTPGAHAVDAGLTPFTLWTRKAIRGDRRSYTS